MKRILFYSLILFAAWGCSVNSPQDQEILVVDSTLANSGKDATPVINRLLEELKEGQTLVFPPGRYDFYPVDAGQKYMMISNNDNGVYFMDFDLTGRKSITIDGQGSEFLFHGHMVPFNIEDAGNITLKNISIDWSRPFHSEGKVVAVDPTRKTFDISIDSQFPYRLEKDQLIWLGRETGSPWEKPVWRQDIRVNLFFDPGNHATVYKVKDYKLNPYFPLLHTQVSAREIEKGLVRVLDTIARLPEPGWVWVSKGELENSRQSPAIRLLGSKNIRFERVVIYHAGAMGIIGERSEDIVLDRVQVILPPGKNRVVTTTADATHFVNCRGHIQIDSCVFENMLDDATNIHGTYLRFRKLVDNRTLGLEAVHYQQNVQRWASPGDKILARDNTTMETYMELEVIAFRQVNERYVELVFDKDVSGIRPRTGFENPAWTPSFTMRNSIVRNNRARSILLSSPKSTLIEGNQFLNPMMAAISIAGDMNYWFESGNVTDLVIRGNYFGDGCTGGFDQAIITIEPIILEPGARREPFHANILIEDNVFETFDYRVLDAKSVANLVFRGNTVKRTKTYKPLFEGRPAINLMYCPGASIVNNRFEWETGAKVVLDEFSSVHEMTGNQGLVR